MMKNDNNHVQFTSTLKDSDDDLRLSSWLKQWTMSIIPD